MFKPSRIVGSSPTDGKNIIRGLLPSQEVTTDLSKEEQRQRLLRRLEKEKHNWKFSPADLKERLLWDGYQKCYEEAINKTSKPHAPWIVIPADNKETARYLVAKSILEELEKYEFHYPELDDEVKDNIKMYHEKLASEK